MSSNRIGNGAKSPGGINRRGFDSLVKDDTLIAASCGTLINHNTSRSRSRASERKYPDAGQGAGSADAESFNIGRLEVI